PEFFPMSQPPIQNLRVHLYGTQGSGSVFPSRAERLTIRRRGEHELLIHVFEDIARHANAAGRLDCSVEELIGGPLTNRASATTPGGFKGRSPPALAGWRAGGRAG